MNEPRPSRDTYTGFRDRTRVASGDLKDVALAVRKLAESDDPYLVLIFDDATGRQLDVDLSGSLAEIATRYGGGTEETFIEGSGPRKRGRPKLGVVGREVTLLPRHWEWLQSQRGGPSATLRRLVDEARGASRDDDRVRGAQDAINRFISSVAGDLPGFEEANRALYRGNRERFEAEIARWPSDVRTYLDRWARHAFNETETGYP